MKFELKFQDKHYIIVDDYPRKNESEIPYIWDEGNFACDCNRSAFIIEQCDKNFSQMQCGHEIELIGIVKED